MSMSRAAAVGLVVAAMAVAFGPSPHAQELEPRAYSPSPVGTNFFAVILSNLSGDILFDPTVPIENAKGDIDSATLGYGRTFGLAGRLGLVTVALPGVYGHFEGQVQEQSRSVRRRGFADLRVKASLNLLGGHAMTPAEFANAPRKTVLGAALTIQAPTGQYDETRLINLGNNRWAFKPELGVSVPVGRWYLDVYGGVWFFTTNDAFFPGASVKTQDPLTSLQAHASYTFENRAWVAIDATWYGGGQVTVDANPPSTRFSNSRYGATFSIPIAKLQSLKMAASRGASARTGSNFDSFVFGWQMIWFDRPSS